MSQQQELRQATMYQEGDFEIVSSDNVLFKVPTYQLQAAS